MAIQATEADTRALVEDLKRQIAGEVRFDKMSRLLYSTDASMYQIEPIGVVLPKSAEDVIAVLETANRYNVPVLPRGGGTSLAGHGLLQVHAGHHRGQCRRGLGTGAARYHP
jgi:FAD/FMN-containing dehydrogenase